MEKPRKAEKPSWRRDGPVGNGDKQQMNKWPRRDRDHVPGKTDVSSWSPRKSPHRPQRGPETCGQSCDGQRVDVDHSRIKKKMDKRINNSLKILTQKSFYGALTLSYMHAHTHTHTLIQCALGLITEIKTRFLLWPYYQSSPLTLVPAGGFRLSDLHLHLPPPEINTRAAPPTACISLTSTRGLSGELWMETAGRRRRDGDAASSESHTC